MSKADEILELLASNESEYSQHWTNDLMDWLSDREDAELVEIMRGCASVLGWRMIGDESIKIKPSAEVFKTAVVNVATAFKENCKTLDKDD